jgi:flagellar basal body-associated protein FliL
VPARSPDRFRAPAISKVDPRPRPTADRSGLYVVASIASSLLLLALFIHWRTTGSWDLPWPFSPPDSPSSQAAVGPVVSLPKVVVRLHGAESDVFLHAAFDLEVASERDKEVVRRQMPRLRDATIAVLSEMDSEDLKVGASAIEKTKGRLLERFQKMIPDRRLESLYVTSYLAFEAQ